MKDKDHSGEEPTIVREPKKEHEVACLEVVPDKAPTKSWQSIFSHIVDVKKREVLIKNISHNAKETNKFLTGMVIGLGEVSDAINNSNFGEDTDE